MEMLTEDLKALVLDGSLSLNQALSLLNLPPVNSVLEDDNINNITNNQKLNVDKLTNDSTVAVPIPYNNTDDDDNNKSAKPLPPPSYESVVVDDAMQDEEDIRNNPTTVIDVLYGHELPQYLETLKSVLTSNNASLGEIENALQSSTQQSFSAVNDHARKKHLETETSSSLSMTDVQDASKFAMAIVELTRFDSKQYEDTQNTSTIVEIINMLIVWNRNGWIETFLMNCLGKIIVDFDLNFTFNRTEKNMKQPLILQKLKSCLKYHESNSNKRLRRQSLTATTNKKMPKNIKDTLVDLEKVVVHDLRQRIALLILKQWKTLNDQQNVNNKKILFASPKLIDAYNNINNHDMEDATTSNNYNNNNNNNRIYKKFNRTRRRTFIENLTAANSTQTTDYSKNVESGNNYDKIKKSPPSPHVRRKTISVAPSRMRVQKEKNVSWYALRPPDSTNVVFKTLGPKGANAALKAGASMFSVPKLETKKEYWTLECNVLANQQIIWEFHAYPASNLDFSLNFSVNVDSNVVIFPSTQASNAPNAGSLQQGEGGTYSFRFSSRNVLGYTDLWCVVRCPKAEREDQEQRRKYVRASRPIVISHAFADNKYLASNTPSTRACFASDPSSEVRMWKRFIGDERITGESPVYIEAKGKFLSISQLQVNKLFFSSVKAEDATLFYIRGIHPSEELTMNKQFELAVVKSDGEYVICTSLEKYAGENELCLTLVREARRDSQEKKFENIRRVTFIASPSTSSRYHGSSDANDPVYRERRLTNLGNDISGKVWLERAVTLGILDTVSSSSAREEALWFQEMERISSLQSHAKNQKHGNQIDTERKNMDNSNNFEDAIQEETNEEKMRKTILEYISLNQDIDGDEIDEHKNKLIKEQRKERLYHILLSIDLIALDFSSTVDHIISMLERHLENDEFLQDDVLLLKTVLEQNKRTVARHDKSHDRVIDAPNEKENTFLQWVDKVSTLAECFATYDRDLYSKILSPSSLTSIFIQNNNNNNNDTNGRKISKLKYSNMKHDLSYDRTVRIAWLQNGILQEDKAMDRATIIEFVISLAMASKTLNNYKMLLCCHDALISMPILRLGKSWGLVRENFHNEFAMLKILCSPYENYRTLRSIMEKRNFFIPCFAPLQNSINHISHLPSILFIEIDNENEDCEKTKTTDNSIVQKSEKFNWNKYLLYHDVIAQQYEASERTFENLPLYILKQPGKQVPAVGERGMQEQSSKSGKKKSDRHSKDEEVLLDVKNLSFNTVIDKNIIMQRSKKLEYIKVGKQNILKSINDVANDVASLIVPKQNYFLPYKHKKDFVGVALLHDVPIFVEIAVETIFCSASKISLEAFEEKFSLNFINGCSFADLIKICSDNIIALSDHVMNKYRSELWSKAGDEAEEMHVRKAVAKVVLGRTQLRLWATVRRDNAIEDEHHMSCVSKMTNVLTDEQLWDLCTDSINDEESLPFLSSWKKAIIALNNIQYTDNPYDKLHFVRSIFQAVEVEAKENKMKPLTADDLMPIILFVVCRSDLPYKWSTLKYIEPFIEIVHSFGGSFSGFDSFCIANFEMAMIIADAYPNFYKQKSLSFSRQTSSSSFFAGEGSPKSNVNGTHNGDDLLAAVVALDENNKKVTNIEIQEFDEGDGIIKRSEGKKINMKELPFID